MPRFGSPAGAVQAILVDASRIAAGTGPVELRTATSASIAMDDAPSGEASELVSLFQTNSVALLVERTFAFVKTDAIAVAVAHTVAW